ncbi:hypothetical protein H8N03_15055 [Ramlibacter sp. USB13]|uniref:Uncharacterized protein n=1 Tax=Ramlibacter cellulosilyticus TaxID=2764187 RepID=A0A923SBW2_9BURK|nr:hypothetical protein [Ramlibacter cellulosilyticus]MBC5784269.1 hypothetical protein [Ramlibacter cellulosilyticus]
MDQPTAARCVPAFAVIAVCIAAVGAATFGSAPEAPPAVVAARPAADASIDVVRAPASSTPAQDGACRTCTLGAGKGWL